MTIPHHGHTRLLLKAAVLLLMGACAGFLYHTVSGIIAGHGVVGSDTKGLIIDLAEAKRAFDTQATVFIDVRSQRSYVARHIPGALHLPLHQFHDRARTLLADVPLHTPIVTYCSGGSCQSSVRLAVRLIEELGYLNTRAFYDGWYAWISAGYPTVSGEHP